MHHSTNSTDYISRSLPSLWSILTVRTCVIWKLQWMSIHLICQPVVDKIPFKITGEYNSIQHFFTQVSHQGKSRKQRGKPDFPPVPTSVNHSYVCILKPCLFLQMGKFSCTRITNIGLFLGLRWKVVYWTGTGWWFKHIHLFGNLLQMLPNFQPRAQLFIGIV